MCVPCYNSYTIVIQCERPRRKISYLVLPLYMYPIKGSVPTDTIVPSSLFQTFTSLTVYWNRTYQCSDMTWRNRMICDYLCNWMFVHIKESICVNDIQNVIKCPSNSTEQGITRVGSQPTDLMPVNRLKAGTMKINRYG